MRTCLLHLVALSVVLPAPSHGQAQEVPPITPVQGTSNESKRPLLPGTFSGTGSEAAEALYAHPNKGRELLRFEWPDASLAMNLLAQAQVAPFVQGDALVDNGDPASTEGFRLRRTRIGFYADYKKQLGVSLAVDLRDPESGGTTIATGTLLYKPFEYLNVALGTAPIPFSRGAMTSSARLQMIERPISIQRIVPASQLGLTLLGSFARGVFEYATGVFNGQPGRYGLGPLNEGLLCAGRIQVAPLGRMATGESDYEQSQPRLAIGADYYYSYDSSTRIHAVSGDVALKWHGLSVQGEVIYDRRSPTKAPVAPSTLPDQTKRLAFYGQAGYFVLPRLLELAVRYEWFDDQMAVDDAGDLWFVTGGGTVFLADGYLKAQVNYQHRHERKVPKLSNDVLFLQFQVNL